MTALTNSYSWIRPLRYIDPQSKDFVYDSTLGHALFPSVTAERVYITLAKILFSSDKVARKFDKTASIEIQNALQFLVDSGKISDVEVFTDWIPGGITAEVRYVNCESKKPENVFVNPDYQLP